MSDSGSICAEGVPKDYFTFRSTAVAWRRVL